MGVRIHRKIKLIRETTLPARIVAVKNKYASGCRINSSKEVINMWIPSIRITLIKIVIKK